MDLPIWQVLLLAVVQGVAEFLPISSSGHIVIIAALLAPDNESTFDVTDLNIVLHLGTLGSIVIVYFNRILRLLKEDRHLIGLLAVATIPAVAIGLPLKMYGKEYLESPLLAGFMLIITGMVLIATSFMRSSTKEHNPITYTKALLIGFAQGAAILPGLSRSGSTIAAAMAQSIEPKTAATFSFLMAIPVIAGGGLLEIKDLISDAPGTTAVSTLILGGFVSLVVGIFSLLWLLRWLERGRFYWFAFWCIPIGIAVIVWQTLLK